MDWETVLFSKEEGFGTLRLNRPHALNAINRTLAAELVQALEHVAQDPEVGVVLLTGEGRAFCAGDDLKEEAVATGGAGLRDKVNNLQRVAWAIRSMQKVVIGMVNGYALGGGCEIALDCDLLIASEKAVFGFPESGVGGTITGGATSLLPRLIGLPKAKELLFIGEFVNAQEAERLGLVNRVVPHESLEREGREMASRLMAKSPLAIALSKASLHLGAEGSFEATLSYEREAAVYSFLSEDFKEGARAFTEKRTPRFPGR